jgi:hypothetical protein
MRKIAIPLVLLALATLAPAGTAAAAPAGPEANPVGTLRWLPDNTNETQPAGLHRLVVIYDRSLNAAGKPSTLLTKGAFGLKIASSSPDLEMKAHSPGVGSLGDEGAPPEIDEAFMGVHGDVRDGACSSVGTSGFSAAFTRTRTFVHPGSSPYQPQNGPGACEVVDSSTQVSGGFQTKVTTHVPGFWIDVDWPTHEDEVGSGGSAHLLADVWYTAVYDTAGEDGDFYETSDAAGASRSLGSPGDYDLTFTAAARPGAVGPPCGEYPSQVPAAAPETYQEIKVQVPAGAKDVTVRLFPHADWDLVVIDPAGESDISGRGPGLAESVTMKAVAGEWTIRACNFAGEPAVLGGVILT